MKVFLDTNVIVSAFATRGICADLYCEVILSHNFITSKTVISESRDVFERKLSIPENLINEIQNSIESNATIEDSIIRHNIPITDKADRILLFEAIESGSTVFVTGDKEILVLERTHSMEIVSPRQFWNKITHWKLE